MSNVVPGPPFPSEDEPGSSSLSKIQSAEAGYNAICTQALDTIRTFLDQPELDASGRDELRRIFPMIEEQRDKILAAVAEAADTLESEDPKETAASNQAYMDTLNKFTETVQELDKHLMVLTEVVARSRTV
ncbi:hypothetical protein D9758_004176 [Tetrapyrgos nigripes]|uniref:Uncharacterized protein n=1 Tax=Tetrapyrgos nigripes TaxID=182062 RepID=A0A8H5GUL9_9AGAR|nr:hypothetical protein D9758_004176 [Tetrapyrgos nigripes]